jgi:SAM-dependent methyltransferase
MAQLVHERLAVAAVKMPPRLFRAVALVVSTELNDIVDLGCGHGELAAYLVGRGARATLIDHSETAIEIAVRTVGESGARFLVDEASELSRHVAPGTQDAIFLTNVVEYLPSSELRWVFRACRATLRPGGACCILTTERYCQPSLRSALATTPGVDLFELGALRGLLAESFESVDAFTWNGTERFHEPGGCDELFAIARAGDAYVTSSVVISQARAAATAKTGWIAATVAEGVSLPSRFHMRATLHIRAAAPDSDIHILFKTGDPARYFWIGVRPQALLSNPAQLMLASESLACVGSANWDDVNTIVMRIRSPSASEADVRISDVRVVKA